MSIARVLPEDERLEPLREASAHSSALRWQRVHYLPDFAYSHHSVHVAAGVGCVSCHGRVDETANVRQVEDLCMRRCLDCHRDPEPHLRPRSELTNMARDRESAGYDPRTDPERVRAV